MLSQELQNYWNSLPVFNIHVAPSLLGRSFRENGFNMVSESNILAEYIALQLNNRVSFRKAMKRAIEITEQVDTKGIHVQIGGHIDGKEIAHVEWVREGRIPLKSIRAKIDHCSYPVRTSYGVLGIKILQEK